MSYSLKSKLLEGGFSGYYYTGYDRDTRSLEMAQVK